jgi:hypothetical protein
VSDVAGFGRSQPVVLLAIVTGALAVVGVPGTAPWAARSAIADAVFGPGRVAVLVDLVGAGAVALAAGRLILTGLKRPAAPLAGGGPSWLGRLPLIRGTALSTLGAPDRTDLVGALALAAMAAGTLAVAFGVSG